MDYKAKLHEDITNLQQATKRGELPREVRLVKIEELAEEYFSNTGEWPDAIALERLSDLCLYEELTDSNEHKVSQTEYPFLSERQFDRRDNREVKSVNGMEGNAADGQRHGKPIRRARTEYENGLVDKRAKTKNAERRKKYREFTKIQPVKGWNMYTGEITQ